MAALPDKDTAGLANGAYNANWLPRAPGLVVVEHKFDNTVWDTASCIVFFKGPFTFLRPAKWFVTAEQLDTNGAPTLAFDIGILNSTSTPTAVSVKWGDGITTLGRAATSSTVADSTGLCAIARNSSSGDIGVNVKTLPATSLRNNQKMIMGVWFVPY